MRLRDTQAKLRRRIKFLGVENGTLPLIISGGLSVCFLTAASGTNNPLLIALALAPFEGTFLYMLVFYSGRRPHFARDLVAVFLEGKAVSPRMKQDQPVNPFYGELRD
jgi:hypothetical protein